MTCGDVRGVIAAYVDGELGGAQRLRVSRHLVECGECAREESGLRELGEMLRGAARLSPVPMDGLEGLAPGVVSRIRAEDRQSFRAKFDRVFEDWHWVAVGSGAFSAAFISVVFVFTILYSPTTQARQMNERVGTLYVMVVPEDGQGEPVILEFERALGSPKRDHRYAVPASFGWKAEQLLVTALDSSLMRHGGSVTVFDDYAHHPTEIEATMRAAREVVGDGRLIIAFQAHHYYRTAMFVDEFGAALGLADDVVVLEVFAPGEEAIPGASGQTLASRVPLPSDHVVFEPSWSAVAGHLASRARPGDLVMTLGAGDIHLIALEVLDLLRQRQGSA